MSLHPRTDAAKFRSDPDCYGQTGWLVFASHAEQLETELAAALAQPDTARAASAMGKVGGRTTGPTKARDPQLMRKAAEVRWAKHRAAQLGTTATGLTKDRA